VILLYAVVAGDEAARLDEAGPVDGGPVDEGGRLDVSVLVDDGIGLVYREVTSAPAADREQVLRFGRVLTALADRTTILPVRFGTALPGLEDARELVRSRAADWRRRLRDVAGHVEVIVHVRDGRAPEVPPGRPATGGEYLRAKVSQHQERSAELARVVSVVAPWCRAARALDSSGGVRLACLVPAGDVPDLRAAVDAWASGHTERLVTVTGPFPVFSFTEDELP